MLIKTKAYPRAALIGNPSDGYFGKTIAFTFSNFQADITLYQSPELEILPAQRDQSRFNSLSALAEDVNNYGYYGGIRLLKAALKKFHDYCTKNGIQLDDRNFTIRYHTSIPAHLGLAGSSAIITACIRALMAFYSVEIPLPVLANLILSVETGELGIGAGLQDRVAQVYQGMVHMDFDRQLMEKQGYGSYTPFKPEKQPDYYIAYRPSSAENTEVVHNNLRFMWERGDKNIINAMSQFSSLTDDFKIAAERSDFETMKRLLNANFDLRNSIMTLNPSHIQMVETARKAGATAKFTGSGGALIGTFEGEEGYSELKSSLNELGCEIFKPEIVY